MIPSSKLSFRTFCLLKCITQWLFCPSIISQQKNITKDALAQFGLRRYLQNVLAMFQRKYSKKWCSYFINKASITCTFKAHMIVFKGCFLFPAWKLFLYFFYVSNGLHPKTLHFTMKKRSFSKYFHGTWKLSIWCKCLKVFTSKINSINVN